MKRMLNFLVFLFLGVLLHSVTGKVNVHMVPHSHDDPGWLKTVDQYYTGSNNTIYLASVQYIFDTVIENLQKSKERTYTMCEISFLSRWWGEQSDETKNVVRQLIKDKRLAVVNGGWVMHDEASAHYVSMIDQTTLGHAFLKREMDYTPKVGWQIDPFGHSNTHAWFSSEFGFDALYFGRIDYQDHDKRMAERTMEMVWKGSASQKQAAVFTGAFTSGNYGAPQSLCFDRSCVYCRDDPVVDDDRLETFNVDQKLDALVTAIEYEIAHSVGDNVMIKMGSDFAYDNAVSWYKSIDVLISKINVKYGDKFSVFYSTPDKYTEARAAETSVKWTVKTDDFFPYSDCAHCFWAGYFTSRPTLKYLERTSSSFLQSLRQTMLFSPVSTQKEQVELDLTAAVGLVNHHDAITGTSKQHVADDYTKILSKALTNAEAVLVEQVSPASGGFSICRYSNESTCAVTQSLNDGSFVDVLVYNSLPRTESQLVRLFVNHPHASVELVDGSTGKLSGVPATMFSTFQDNVSPEQQNKQGQFTVVFMAENVQPLSSQQYHLSVFRNPSQAPSSSTLATLAQFSRMDGKAFTVKSKRVSVSFAESGLMSHVQRLDPEQGGKVVVEADVSNDLRYYAGFGSPGQQGFKYPPIDERSPSLKNIQPSESAAIQADVSTQPSGAYVFRPFPADHLPLRMTKSTSILGVVVVQSGFYTEVRQTFSNWATQIIRINDGSDAIELEWTVGPVPVEDNIGKEVVSMFESDLFSGEQGANEFFTDANGREFQKRIFNFRPTWDLQVHEPIAGNYYPVTAAMYIQDKTRGIQLSVLTDRAQAAASLRSGELEFMVHRRLLADDERGVNEALNETTGGISGYPTWQREGDGITVRGRHWLILSTLDSGVRDVRTLMDEVYAPVLPLFSAPHFAPAPAPAKLFSLGTGIGTQLPLNLQLLTLHRLPQSSSNMLFLRLAHQFAVGEDANLSTPVSVDLAELLAPFKPVAKTLAELNLSGNQLQGDMLKNKVQWNTVDGSAKVMSTLTDKEGSMVVTLTPMQIKTFVVVIQ